MVIGDYKTNSNLTNGHECQPLTLTEQCGVNETGDDESAREYITWETNFGVFNAILVRGVLCQTCFWSIN